MCESTQRQKAASESMSSSKKTKRKVKRSSETQSASEPSGGSVHQLGVSRRTADREDGAAVTGLGADDKVASRTVGALLALDVGLGAACVTYGALVHVTAAMATTISYGVVLLVGAFAGAMGLYTGACIRRGLLVSAIAGFLAFLLDVGALVVILLSWDTFILFMKKNYEHLMLSEDSLKTIQGLKIPLVTIFAALAALEILR